MGCGTCGKSASVWGPSKARQMEAQAQAPEEKAKIMAEIQRAHNGTKFILTLPSGAVQVYMTRRAAEVAQAAHGGEITERIGN